MPVQLVTGGKDGFPGEFFLGTHGPLTNVMMLITLNSGTAGGSYCFCGISFFRSRTGLSAVDGGALVAFIAVPIDGGCFCTFTLLPSYLYVLQLVLAFDSGGRLIVRKSSRWFQMQIIQCTILLDDA
uniref:Uncharacterized protein n=1 Tax=Anopheles atroparvus TaxID=41427 RepID=A0A182J9L0_ANOAO